MEPWPPKDTERVGLYFGANEHCPRDMARPPAAARERRFDEFVSDPAHPVPYRQRPIQPTYFPGGSKWSTWLVEDQRFVDDRPDVLSWESRRSSRRDDRRRGGGAPFASTTGTDADWIVKLIDVYPESYPENWDLAGYQLMVSNEVFRGRYRKSFEKPAPIRAGQVQEYTFGLHTQNYTFKGHRIMVQVQSTWFPLIDRNPQTFTKNIFEARGAGLQKATHRVYRSARYPSSVEVPVVVASGR